MPPIKIAVAGSLMMDLVVRAPRMPRAGESLLAHGFATYVGGKGGNQATAALRAGAEHVSMIGRVGRDEFGEQVVVALKGEGVDCANVGFDAAVGTGVAVAIVMDDGSNSIFAIPRANLALSADDIDASAEAIRSARMLLVQFEIAPEATLRAMQIAHGAGVPVMLNAAPIAAHPADVLALATYVVVNEVEAQAVAPEAGANHVAEAEALLARGPAAAFVTLGEHGCVVAMQGATEFVPALAVRAIDTVGAGDAFCGALAVALCEGRGFFEATRFAAAAGALAVTRAGAAASLPARREIESLLGSGVHPG